jgi:hypothetical protein
LCQAHLAGFVCFWRRSRIQSSRWSTEGAQDREQRVVCKAQVIIVWPEDLDQAIVQDVDSFMVSQDLQEVNVTIVFMVLTILVFRLLTICL